MTAWISSLTSRLPEASINQSRTSNLKGYSACHRLFEIPEMLEAVVHEVWMQASGAASVASLAATCRSLHDIVVPLLWSHLNSLIPLMKTLPPSSWHEEQRSDGTKVLRLRPVFSIDLSRFEYYTAYVRRFDWEDHGDFDYATLQFLFERVPPTFALLPQIRLISLHNNWLDCVPPARFLVGHELQHVRLNIVTTDPANDIRDYVLGLRDLSADPASFRLDLSFRTSRIDQHALYVFMSLRPSVKNLAIIGPNFQNLKSLRFGPDTLDDKSLSLLESLSAAEVVDLSIDSKHHSCAPILSRHFEKIRDNQPALEKLLVQLRGDETKTCLPPCRMSADTFSPLLQLSRLTSLRIDGGLVDLDLAGVQTLACSLPHLRALHIIPGAVDSAPLPIMALLHVSSHCMELESVGLSIDAREHQIPMVPSGWHSASRVSSLWLVNSPIDTTPTCGRAVVNFLTLIFPTLQYMDHRTRGLDINTRSDWMQSWVQVADQIAHYSLQPELREMEYLSDLVS